MAGRQDHSQSWALRIIDALLKLYPPRFRQAFSAEIMQVLSGRLSDAELRGRWPFAVLREVAALPPSIVREHWRELTVRMEAVDRAQAKRAARISLERTSGSFRHSLGGCLLLLAVVMLPLGYPLYIGTNLYYSESKGPFKNWLQPVDLDGDGDLDVLVSHTRWERPDIAWAGIGMWINQGDGTFALVNDPSAQEWPFLGNAAAAGDLDGDGDADMIYQEFRVRVALDKTDARPGERGKYETTADIELPPVGSAGHLDTGGTITLGDLNGDGRLDAFVAGCCYGLKAWEPGYQNASAPSVSWVWINDGSRSGLNTGRVLRMDFLDGRPVRQAALGDLDADGDLDAFAAVNKPTMGTATGPPGGLVLLNDGTGVLSAHGQPLGAKEATSVALGDVDGDGLPDALVGTAGGAQLWINQGDQMGSGAPMFVQGDQSFRGGRSLGGLLGAGVSAVADKLLGVYLPYGSVRTKAVFLADLDGDGDPDAVLARLFGAEVWRNDGGGAFSRLPGGLAYPENSGVAVADFDGDGDPDIFAGANEHNQRAWWNDGGGIFTGGSVP